MSTGLRLAAVVPAAGLSSRMGRLKPALPLGGSTVLALAVACLRAGGADDIVAVTGREPETVAALAREAGARVVHNPDFQEGMFSSMLAGVRALPPDADAFFVLPADIPLVRPATVRLLAQALAARPGSLVVYPRFGGERGHPPLIGAALAPRILGHDGQGGLRAVLAAVENESPELAMDVDTADAGTLLDLDRPEDYEAAQQRMRAPHLPLPREVEALWNIAGTPGPTRAHCRAVARAAWLMAGALNARRAETGAPPLDPALAEAAGLLHDVAKGRANHEEQGALIVVRHGFGALAPAIAAHRDLPLAPDAPLTERELVFLADKYVRGESLVPLEQRYREKIEQWGREPHVRDEIEDRMRRAQTVRNRLAEEMGTDPHTLLARGIS
ncbi:DVU_1551 family NTP transferase [Desulfocurvus sp. DL9XJH121]